MLGELFADDFPLKNAAKQAADRVLQVQRLDEKILTALREAFAPAMVRLSERAPELPG